MDNTENKNITKVPETAAKPVAPHVAPAGRPHFSKPRQGGMGGTDSRAKYQRRGGHGRPERIKQEFDQKILNIRRVTRVTKGGKRLNFSVYMVVGNKKGSVGVGTGKANDTSLAIDKAYRNAKYANPRSIIFIAKANNTVFWWLNPACTIL